MPDFFIPFTYKRHEPKLIQAVEYGQPLVQFGGWTAISTEAYEAARLTNAAADITGSADTYATALLGGEPYAEWI